MKKIILLFGFACLQMAILLAQTPDGFNYQGVARNSTGTILLNQAISLRMSILQGSASGITVYSETHGATSNDYGVFDLVVGNGSVISGNFSTIDWGADIYFLKVEMDGTGGTNYEFMGTSQLLSVPYSLHSKTAENAHTVNYDSITNIPANLTTIVNNNFSGDYSELTNTPTIPINISELNNDAGYLTTEVDGSVTNELQVLSISNDTIFLTNGGFVKRYLQM
ncbi:MAG: hypothetical protein HY738_10910 [Bacteroidia bacterium]|nr:hypothetical protein [Bacteroidia bacterium]